VGNGDAKTTNRGPASQHVRVLRNPIERVRHGSIIAPTSHATLSV
jgi:hypothetical protein